MKTINTFANESEYKDAIAKMKINEDARISWCIADGQNINKMTSVPCDISNSFPYANEVTNDLRSKVELWEFMNNKPAKYFLYINEEKKCATNWTGEFLGNVHFGREYKTNMGDKRQPIDVYAVNGIKYYGIYFKSAGSYARITKFKNQ